MESSTLGGTMRHVARGAVSPACREGRVSKVIGDRLEVAVRSLTGDLKTMPARGYQPRVVQDGPDLVLLDAVRGDACWVIEDEGGQFVVVEWEPLG